MKIALIFLTLFTFSFAGSIAKIMSKSGKVLVVRNGSQTLANTGTLLLEGDRVATDRFSKARIVFIDKTVISIGRNSNLLISRYAYDNKGKEAFFSFTGAMKTVTGQIGKINPEKFKVRVKTSTIGIRGTKFYIDTSRNTTAACIDGAITVSKPKIWGQKLKTKIGSKLYSKANDTIRDELFKSNPAEEVVVNAGQLTKIGPSGVPSIPRGYSLAEIQALGGLIGLSAAEMMFDLGISGGAKKEEKKHTLKQQVHKKESVEKKEDRFKIHEL